MTENPSLPESIRRLMVDKRNTVVVSAASAWEMATEVRLGRLPAASDITRNFQEYLKQSGFESLPVSAEHGIRAGLLPRAPIWRPRFVWEGFRPLPTSLGISRNI